MAPILEARGIVKTYPGVTAVDHVDLAIEPGACFGLLGPNGAGKTTLIEIMEGIKRPDSGAARYEGAPVGAKFRREAGIQFQATSLQEFLTVRETITLFRDLYPKALAMNDLVRLLNLDEILDRDTRKLSGGQRQRLPMALALVNDPVVLFLDEPTTGLDPQARRNFWDLIRMMKAEGRTTVLTTMKRFLAVMHARNMEFIRDRSSLGWNILFPLLLVLAFSVVFSGEEKPLYKVGVLGDPARLSSRDSGFFATRYLQFIPVTDLDKAIDKVEHFQLDMLVDVREGRRYWVNGTSPGGYLLERIPGGEGGKGFQRVEVQGRKIRYVDWVVPGVLAMNMMFSCLFGVGYVIVRYRKNGFLKRLKATPLRPFEFLLAQMTSRLILIQVITIAVYAGCDQFIYERGLSRCRFADLPMGIRGRQSRRGDTVTGRHSDRETGKVVATA